MKAPYLIGLSENDFYQSEPDVGAGSAARGFVVSTAFQIYGTGIFTLAANYDDANDRGWRLMAATGGNGSVQLSAEIGIDDGVAPGTLVQSGWFAGLVGQAVDLTLVVGNQGAPATVALYANGNILFAGSTGAGFSYAPAAGQPLQIGGLQTAPTVGVATGAGAAMLGAGFVDSYTAFGSAFVESLVMGTYIARQQLLGYSPFRSEFGTVPGLVPVRHADFAWDTKSLLEEGLRREALPLPPLPPEPPAKIASPGATWVPAPESGDQDLTRQGDAGLLAFQTFDTHWWHPSPGSAPGG